jgi:hypothetical protein
VLVVTSGILLPSYKISGKWTPNGGFEFTLTGYAEIIVAIGVAIGVIIRALKTKGNGFNPSKR